MKNNKIIIFSLTIMVCLLSALNINQALAANNTAETNKEEFKKPENEIFGKIVSIDSNSVTIEVAERKKLEKPNKNDEDKNKQPQKNDDMRKEFNMDDMFTLTGDKKTIDISTAKFISAPFGRPNDTKDKQKEINNNEDIKKDNKENIQEKTYKDYSVGDYVSIELIDKTSLKAKTVRDAKFGRRGERPDKPIENK